MDVDGNKHKKNPSKTKSNLLTITVVMQDIGSGKMTMLQEKS
jgi:hypothetical protein